VSSCDERFMQSFISIILQDFNPAPYCAAGLDPYTTQLHISTEVDHVICGADGGYLSRSRPRHIVSEVTVLELVAETRASLSYAIVLPDPEERVVRLFYLSCMVDRVFADTIYPILARTSPTQISPRRPHVVHV
jgi:hypothetical protein